MVVVLMLALFIADNRLVFAQPNATNQSWAYLLLDGSFLTDDCPVCGRPTIQAPMRGRFNLRLLEQDSLFSHYTIEDIEFKPGTTPLRAAAHSGLAANLP